MSVAIRQMIQQGAYAQALAALPDYRVLRNDAERLYLRGVSHAALGQQPEAERCAERGAELEPEAVRFHMLLASLVQGRDPERARQLFVHVISLNPNIPDAHTGLANLAAARGAHEQAESQYRTALRAQADHVPTLLSYGRLLISIQRTDEGLALVNRVLRRDAQNPDAQALAARALMAKGNLEFARKALDNALAMNPDHADALLFSAQLRARQEQWQAALVDIGRLLQLRPLEPGVLLLGAEICQRAGDEASSTALLTRLVKHHPRNELGVLKLADLYAAKNPGAAAGLLARHAQGMPESALLWKALLNLLRSNGALEEALARAQEWSERAPEEPQAWAQLALLAEYFEQFDLADDAALRTARLAPQSSEAALVQARSALRGSDPKRALGLIEGLAQLPAEGQLRHELERARGRALLELERHSPALAAFRAAAMACVLDPQPAPLPRSIKRISALPELETVRHRPICFLVGNPGSGVDAIGRFLAAQAECHVLTDRYSRQPRTDLISDRSRWEDAPGEGVLALARSRYLRGIERLRLPPQPLLVDWLPQLDVRLFDVLRGLLPEAQFLVVQRDPRDALCHAVLHASGGPAYADPLDLAEAIGAQTVHLAQILATHGAPVVSVGFEDLQSDAGGALTRLAQALHLPAFSRPEALSGVLRERGGIPRYLPSGHWQLWSKHLEDALARL